MKLLEKAEEYAYIRNGSDALFKFNDQLQDCSIIKLSLSEFEQKFRKVIVPYEVQSNDIVHINGESISKPFYEALKTSLFSQEIMTGPYFLKYSRLSEVLIDNSNCLKLPNIEAIDEFNRILLALRLSGQGGIEMPTNFLIGQNSRSPYITAKNITDTNASLDPKFQLTKWNSDDFKAILDYNFFSPNWMFPFAIEAFEESYKSGMSNVMKFISIITALESMLNHGKDQIAHTISRHVAIIVSSNNIEFQEEYKKMKKIYGIRSKILHGSSIKNMHTISNEEIEEVRDICRVVIRYCIKHSMSKELLFQTLNSKGF